METSKRQRLLKTSTPEGSFLLVAEAAERTLKLRDDTSEESSLGFVSERGNDCHGHGCRIDNSSQSSLDENTGGLGIETYILCCLRVTQRSQLETDSPQLNIP